ncbi:hypothetical protein BHE74_00039791 [Ensete ventricosum]|nr:hypothetical protein GW17_00043141 [Ensete ventricosum]RWW53698.1 hypothetical protein BHE74_00039791 [Ensete ventricosum]
MSESFPRRWDRANWCCRRRGTRIGRHDCDVGMRSHRRTLLSLFWIVRVGRTRFYASITRHRLGRAATRASPMEIEQKWKLEDRILSTQKTKIPSFGDLRRPGSHLHRRVAQYADDIGRRNPAEKTRYRTVTHLHTDISPIASTGNLGSRECPNPSPCHVYMTALKEARPPHTHPYPQI